MRVLATRKSAFLSTPNSGLGLEWKDIILIGDKPNSLTDCLVGIFVYLCAAARPSRPSDFFSGSCVIDMEIYRYEVCASRVKDVFIKGESLPRSRWLEIYFAVKDADSLASVCVVSCTTR